MPSKSNLIFGIPWISTVAELVRVTSGFVYFIGFTSFLLGGKITGALAAASAPETDYSSASYAPLLWSTCTGKLSYRLIVFGVPWIADLAVSINVIAGFV